MKQSDIEFLIAGVAPFLRKAISDVEVVASKADKSAGVAMWKVDALEKMLSDITASLPDLVQRAVQEAMPVEVKSQEPETDVEDLAAALIAKFTEAALER